MKRAGIITLYGLENYGNRLQNYAVQKVLTDMGMDAKTYTHIWYNRNPGRKMLFKWHLHNLTNYRFCSDAAAWKVQFGRVFAFREFTRRYIPTELVPSLENLGGKADYFVLGSDQVWNPEWYYDLAVSDISIKLYLLTFAKPEQKVCFAPSFGIEKLPDKWLPSFQEYLPTFPKLSVREDAGARIIKEITGCDAEVLIDPTLMLDAEDWLKLAKKPKNVDTEHPYILTYFLGNRTKQVKEDIRELQQARDLNAHHLVDQAFPDLYVCGPSEFVYLISKADLILTDSFHACVFSFLFGKPFVVYDRDEAGVPQMNSRLETLLPALHLERKYKGSGIDNDVFECDYQEGKKQLESLRLKAQTFLRDAIHEE